jgi:gamma-glutamylcyclotransferase (GGCT)/AIG2-like uncharacterized protein YtfP
MASVFTYGTLMYEEVWLRVVGSQLAGERATLEGYLRRQIKGDVYPAIYPGEGQVIGVLYAGLSDGDLVRLDAFEGDYYLRTQVEVETVSSGPVKSHTYVLKPEYYPLIGEEWSRVEFETSGLRQFISQYKGFHR